MASSTRRDFLGRAALAGGAAVSMPLYALSMSARGDTSGRYALGYGPLRPVADETTGLALLQLPEGFRYLSFG